MTTPPDRRVGTTEAAEILDIPRDLIAKWKHRGDITPVGLLRSGAPLYDLEQLRPLAERYHQRRLTRARGRTPRARPE